MPRWCGPVGLPHAGESSGLLHPFGYSSVVEQQPIKLSAAGSTPALQPSKN